MLPRFNVSAVPGPIRKAVLALLGRTSRPERQPPLPPFAARLCQSKSATDLRTPPRSIGLRTRLPHFKGKAVTASSQLFRSFHLLHNCQLAVLVSPPWPPKGKTIAREPLCQRGRQCPESAFHNIISSELCNSVRHRYLFASEEEVCMGQKPAKPPYRAADYTIRIMLRTLRDQSAKVLPPNSRARRRQERVWRQWPGCTRSFASPAPGRGIGAPYPPIPLLRCRSASAASIFEGYHPHQS